MKHRFNEIIEEELDKENDCKKLVCTKEFSDLAKRLLNEFCSWKFPEFNDLELVAFTISNNKISVIGINWINDEIYYEISKELVEIKTKSNTFYFKAASNKGSFTSGFCDFEFNYIYNGDIVSIKGIHQKNMTISLYTDIDEDDNLSIIEKHNNYSDLIPDCEIKYDCYSTDWGKKTNYDIKSEFSLGNFHIENERYWNFYFLRRTGMKFSDNYHQKCGNLDFRTYKR